jgi:hypothetical protein
MLAMQFSRCHLKEFESNSLTTKQRANAMQETYPLRS